MKVNEQYKKIEIRNLEIDKPFRTRIYKVDPVTGTPKIEQATIPAGISKTTGKPYQTFNIYNLPIVYKGDSEWQFTMAEFLANQVSKFKEGDLIEFTKFVDGNKIKYKVEKVEEDQAQKIANMIKEKVGSIPEDITEQDITDTMKDMEVSGATSLEVLGELKKLM